MAGLLRLALKWVGKMESLYGEAYGTVFFIIIINSVLNIGGDFLLGAVDAPEAVYLVGGFLLIAAMFGVAMKFIGGRHHLSTGRAALVALTLLVLNAAFVLVLSALFFGVLNLAHWLLGSR